MAETNAVPTTEEVTTYRVDIANYLTNSKTVDNYTAQALAQFKLDLDNKRSIRFVQIFDTTEDLYFVNTNDETRNDDNAMNLLSNLTISMIFRDFAISENDSQWMDLSTFYRAEYDDTLKVAKLDVDADDSGGITADEEGRISQTFMRK